MSQDTEIQEAADRASVNKPARIDLRQVGAIAGMSLYVDVAGQDDPTKSYDLAVKVLYETFVKRKRGNDGKAE